MKKLIILFTLLNCFSINAQTLQLGEDTSLCIGQNVQIVAHSIDSSIFFPLSNPNYLSLPDDRFSDVIDIGFDFTFYDSTYNQLLIGQNGMLCFDLSQTDGNGVCTWQMSNPLPNSFNEKNSIYFPHIDISGFNSPFIYKTIGTAPNRKFIVQIQSATLYGFCGLVSSSVVLCESSNDIEIHIGNRSICSVWNQGKASQGLHYRTDSLAHLVPNRNAQAWEVFQEAKKWTPDGPLNYIISDIPYMLAVDSFEIVWANWSGDVLPYSDTLNVLSDSTWNGIQNYFLAIVTNGGPNEDVYLQSISSDSTTINHNFTTQSISTTKDFCQSGTGEIIIQTQNATDSSFFWVNQGIYSDTLSNLYPGTYEFVFEEQNGCISSHEVVIENDTLFEVIYSDSLSCPESNDGQITILPNIEDASYSWIEFPSVDTNYLEYLTAGGYTCITNLNQCTDTFLVNIESGTGISFDSISIVGESCYMSDDGSLNFSVSTQDSIFYVFYNGEYANQTTSFYSLGEGSYHIQLLDSNNCQSNQIFNIPGPTAPLISSAYPSLVPGETEGSVTIDAAGGTPPYQYSIGQGNQSSNEFQNIEFGEYECIVTDANGCTDTVTFVINQELSLDEKNGINPIIYPNPTKDVLFVELKGNFNLQFINPQGKVVYSAKNILNEIKLPMNSIANGMYTIVIQSNDQQSIRKLVVNH